MFRRKRSDVTVTSHCYILVSPVDNLGIIGSKEMVQHLRLIALVLIVGTLT